MALPARNYIFKYIVANGGAASQIGQPARKAGCASRSPEMFPRLIRVFSTIILFSLAARPASEYVDFVGKGCPKHKHYQTTKT